MTSPLIVSALPRGYKWVDIVYTNVNKGRFTLKLIKYQVVAHLLTEVTVSGGSCRKLQSVLGKVATKAAISENYCVNIFGELPKGIIHKRDLKLEEYNVIFFHRK